MKISTVSVFGFLALMASSLSAGLSAMPAWAGLFDIETKLNASDAAVADQFGYSVAISGNTAIVGSYRDDSAGSSSDSAYLFDVTTGNQLFKLTASDASAGDEFGFSVAISGNTAIVGARFDDGVSTFGSAYLFDVATGNELFKLTGSDATEDDRFGFSVAISGNTAIVGSDSDQSGGSDSGSAYLFDVTTGNELFKLTASGAMGGDRFGHSVAISDNMALVGADNDDGTGSAYLFDVTTGNQLLKFTASDAAAGDRFGHSVSISGNKAMVGADSDDDGGSESGSAYLFDVLSGNQLWKLTATDASADDRFGHSVAISGNTAIVGAQRDDNTAGVLSGSAYLFDVATGNQLLKLAASDSAAEDRLGQSVSISGNTAIAGARLHDDGALNSGSAYLFMNDSADFDGDLDVDGADFLKWQRDFGDSLDSTDLENWEANFGTSANTVASSVPEPGSAPLCLLAVGFFDLARTRRQAYCDCGKINS